MFLISFEASNDVMVLAPSLLSMMLGFLTSSWFFSSCPTSVRNILRPQVLCAGFHSICNGS